MRFIALVISIMFFFSLPALATATEESPSPAPTASPAAATTTTALDPMDPKYQAFYPRNEVEAETRNPGGEWRRGEYGKMLYTPPVRKHAAAATTPSTTTTTNTTTTTRVGPNTRVTVTVSVAPESDVPSPETTTAPAPAATPKKTSAPWNLGWLWSTLQFLGWLVLLAAVAVGVWAIGRTWGMRAGATTGVLVVVLGAFVWLAL